MGLGAVIGGIKVLDHLYIEEKEDYERSEYTKIRLPADVSAFETLQNLKTRFMSRITSYIITICTIDGILKRSYTHFGVPPILVPLTMRDFLLSPLVA